MDTWTADVFSRPSHLQGKALATSLQIVITICIKFERKPSLGAFDERATNAEAESEGKVHYGSIQGSLWGSNDL